MSSFFSSLVSNLDVTTAGHDQELDIVLIR